MHDRETFRSVGLEAWRLLKVVNQKRLGPKAQPKFPRNNTGVSFARWRNMVRRR